MGMEVVGVVGVTGAIGLTGAVCGGLLGTNIDRGGVTGFGGTTGIGSRSMRTSLGLCERLVTGATGLGAVTGRGVLGVKDVVLTGVTGCGTSGNGSMKILLLDGAKAVGELTGGVKLG